MKTFFVQASVLSCLFGCSASGAAQDDFSGSSAGSGSVIAFGASGYGGTGAGGGTSSITLPDAGARTGAACAPKAVGLVRDFRADDGGQYGHPDFQSLTLFRQTDFDAELGYPEPGIVAAELGSDRKPVFSGGTFRTVESTGSFDAWYRDVADVNMATEYELPLAPDPLSGHLVYDTAAFFPVDQQGFGDYGPDMDGVVHNFHFTFELHMTFAYQSGDIFRFRGDDDLFVFIAGKLVIDLGGVHAPMEGEVDLDARAQELGLVLGGEYPIDIFQAERYTDQSNFRVETSLSFTNCDPIIVR